MFVYEVIPSYIFPLLNGINIVCLSTQHASAKSVDIITNLFGGIDGNEGLGFFSFSFDWQYITSTAMSYPLTQQGETKPVSSMIRSAHRLVSSSQLMVWHGYLLHRHHGHILF